MISPTQLGEPTESQAKVGLFPSYPVSHSPGAVTIEQADPREYRADVVRLFEQDGKTDFRNQFDWYYRNRGQQTPYSWLLRGQDGRIQGLISVTARPLRFGGMPIRAGITGNLIVDRKSGIYFGASSLVRAAQSLVNNHSVDVLLGIPNEFSQRVFRRLKFRTLDRWRTYAQLFRCRNLLVPRIGFPGVLASPFLDLYADMRRLTHGYYRQRSALTIVEIEEDRLNELQLENWQHAKDQVVVASTCEYLQWRFLRCPSKQYSISGVQTESGEICGYLVLRHTPGRLWIVDCEVDASRLTKSEAILCFCRHCKAGVDSVWVPSLRSSVLSKNLAARGFVSVSASIGGYPDYPLVGFWSDEHPLANIFSQASSWDLLPGFNDV